MPKASKLGAVEKASAAADGLLGASGEDDTPANLVALEAVLGDRYELVLARSGPEGSSRSIRETPPPKRARTSG